MLGLGYDTNDSADEDEERQELKDSSSSGSDTSDESIDSATRRSRQAAAKLYDHEQVHEKVSSLPQAADLFGEVDGPPKFLNPEATQQTKVYRPHFARRETGTVEAIQSGKNAGSNFNIAKLAPVLAGDPKDADKGKTVLSSAAKPAAATKSVEALYNNDALIAMMGGGAKDSRVENAETKEKSQGPPRKKSKAMDVEDFMAQGLGAAQLPRSKQDRKEKEKSKRGLGQSSVHGWKSEAEMVMRQQYD